jgi:hypothetical protein
MNFGYLLIISENDSVDYLKMAYALALSIKNTQELGYDKVALVTDNIDAVKNLKSPWVFDHIIEWNQEKGWNGRSWMDKLSPFDYTVCLDVDMLFFNNHSYGIKELMREDRELCLPSKVYTYRNELVNSDFYRKTFTMNLLPNLYSFFTFFKKDSLMSQDFFELGRHIIKNPVEFSNLFLSKYKPKIVGTDEAFALSAKILGIDEIIGMSTEFPRVVHLKPMIQNWPWPADNVFDHVGFYFDKKATVKIGCFQQENILHYVDKQIITDEYISNLEVIAWKK